MEYDIALTQFNESLSRNPEIAEIYAGIGFVYYVYMEYEAAIENIKQAAILKPDYMPFVIGIEAEREGNYELALTEYNRLINNNFEIINAYAFRANLYSKMSEYNKAIEDYLYILEIFPDYISGYLSIGTCYISLLDFNKGIESINEAIKRNPNNYFNRLNRGISFYLKAELEKEFGDSEQAKLFSDMANIDFEEAIKRNPVFIGDNYLLGMIYMLREQYSQSIEYTLNAINADTGLFEAFDTLGQIYQKMENWDLAIYNHNEAIRINPNYVSAYLNLASIYSDLEMYDDARNYYNLAINISSNNPMGYMGLGFIYFIHGNMPDATRMFRRMHSITPNSFISNFLLGTSLSFNDPGGHSTALLYLTKALQSIPGSVAVQNFIQESIDVLNFTSGGLTRRIEGNSFSLFTRDGIEFAKGTVTGSSGRLESRVIDAPIRITVMERVGDNRTFSYTHIFDIGSNSLITIDEFLKNASDLGLTDQFINFLERTLGSID